MNPSGHVQQISRKKQLFFTDISALFSGVLLRSCFRQLIKWKILKKLVVKQVSRKTRKICTFFLLIVTGESLFNSGVLYAFPGPQDPKTIRLLFSFQAQKRHKNALIAQETFCF